MRPSKNHQVHQHRTGEYHWCVKGTKIVERQYQDSVTGEKLTQKTPTDMCLGVVDILPRYFCAYNKKTGVLVSLTCVRYSRILEYGGLDNLILPQTGCECCEIFNFPESGEVELVFKNSKVDINSKKLISKL